MLADSTVCEQNLNKSVEPVNILKEGSLFDNGHYKILKNLGDGYCSNVYLAEECGNNETCSNETQSSSNNSNRDGELKRRGLVALKVFKNGDEFTQMAKNEFELISLI